MVVILTLAVVACARPRAVAGPGAPARMARMAQDGAVRQVGKASWYGTRHHGRPTASGEPFDQHALTAAHPTLPFGTLVRVTNRANGRSVDVRINDRGGHGRGRIIDVSFGAAKRLDMVRAGVVPCEIVIVRLGRRAR